MTREEWRGCADPRAMVRFLGARFTERKTSLLAAALTQRTGRSFPLLDVLGDAPPFGTFFTEEAAAHYETVRAELRALACAALRDQFNPFWAGVVDPRWLSAEGGVALDLLQGIED